MNSRKNIKDINNYQEEHHIIPKCLGGTNDKENLIWLYAEEHYYAHKLLALENPHNKAIIYGWHCLSTRNQIKLSAEEYKEVKQAYSEIISGENHPMYGRHHTKEAKRRISEFQKERKDTEETKEKKRQNFLKNNPAKRQDIKEKMKKNHADFTGGKSSKAKKIICLETLIVYESIATAAKENKISRQSISANLTGRTMSAHKYH